MGNAARITFQTREQPQQLECDFAEYADVNIVMAPSLSDPITQNHRPTQMLAWIDQQVCHTVHFPNYRRSAYSDKPPALMRFGVAQFGNAARITFQAREQPQQLECDFAEYADVNIAMASLLLDSITQNHGLTQMLACTDQKI